MAERALLARRYEEKGIPTPQAKAIAERLIADPARALDAIAREQLRLDPSVPASPHAAAASFLTFAPGALVPLVPFLLAGDWAAVLLSDLLSGVALSLVGVAVSFFTARHPLLSGARMLAIGAAAASVTFLIGRLVGVSALG